MSYTQRIISPIIISLTFFLVWSQIVLDHFYLLGDLLFQFRSFDLKLILAIVIPFSLLILVLFFKSKFAYGFTMFIFALMILVSIGYLPANYEYYSTGPRPEFTSEFPPTAGGLVDCVKTIAYATIGYSLMNTKTLLEVYSWDIKKSRMVSFIAVVLYIMAGVIYRLI